MNKQTSHQPIQIYVVGGYVRDTLLGITPKDQDFVVVGATEQWMTDRGFNKINGTSFPVFLDSHGREYALARKERKVGVGYQGFECEFDPSVTLEDDLFRRDLTINAMALPVDHLSDDGQVTINDSCVIDPFNGRTDLDFHMLRHVSNHFVEDPVRVLRIARFAARYGFVVHPDTTELIQRMCNNGELEHLVFERVWTELEKAMGETIPSLFFETLLETDAGDIIFPGLRRIFEKNRMALDSATTVKQRIAIMYEGLSTVKMPTSIEKFATKFNTLIHAPRWFSVDDTMDLFERLDVYRDASFLAEARETAMAFGPNSFLDFLTRKLLEAFEVSKDIGFHSLTEEQRETLKGKRVGLAIRALRLAAIKNV